MTAVRTLIDGAREAVNALRTADPSIDEIPDACGWVRELEVMLADWRHTQESKLRQSSSPLHDESPQPEPVPGPIRGEQFELVPTHRTDRTYNTPRLLADLSAAMCDMTGHDVTISRMLAVLQDRNVVEIKWRWTDLKAYCKAMGVTLNIGHDELDPDADLESPHVGEVKHVTGYKRVRVGP